MSIEQDAMRGSSLLLMLAFLSGACGLGYEIIYIRVLSSYFGDAFHISAALLSAIFLGISFGSFFAHRLIGKLWIIELSIGVFSFSLALAIHYFGFSVSAGIEGYNWLNPLKLYLLLLPPTFLIGTCIPLFSHYVSVMQSSERVGRKKSTFAHIYSFYNLGAVLSILLIEFYLYRQFGVLAAISMFAVLNLIIGLYLRAVFEEKLVTRNPEELSMGYQLGELDDVVPLILISAASGATQLYFLQVIMALFGPINENFAIVFANAILGIALGSAAYRMFRWSFRLLCICLVFSLLFSSIIVHFVIETWSGIAAMGLAWWLIPIIKASLISLLTLPFFVSVGSVVPLFVERALSKNSVGSSPKISGTVLGISSLANGLGTLIFISIIYGLLPLNYVVIFVSILIVLAILCARNATGKFVALACASVMLGAIGLHQMAYWPKADFLLGYKVIADERYLTRKRAMFESADEYRSQGQNAALVYYKDASRSLVFNGYQSLTFDKTSRTDLHEAIVGISPALFNKSRENALVLGLGTGISAGATATVFDAVEVSEINPAIFEIPPYFAKENFKLLEADNATLNLEDGITKLRDTNIRYDAIINTVTSPRYFSAVKMYTRDFYELVGEALNENGVYSGWFDINIGTSGISIMLNTLEESFRKCRYFVLSSGYFNVVCGNGLLEIHDQKNSALSSESHPLYSVLQSHGFGGSFASTFRALEVEFTDDFFDRQSDEINTLDRPAIEFANLSLADKSKLQDALLKMIEKNIQFQKLAYANSQRWKQSCLVLRHMIRQILVGC